MAAIIAGTLEELSSRQVHDLYKLRVDVFVAEQATPYAEIDEEDTTATHLLAYDGEQIVGCGRCMFTPDRMQFGRFVVTPSARGTGVSREIMDFAMQLAGERELYLTAQQALVPYYQRYGFEPVGELYDDTGVPHQPMLRPAPGQGSKQQ
ncbi:GNAT family N-acetyltransferase [Corynebacterium tapiri]|uniref:GNAT family N-acetyltransferase n=1 Tax=Corynebacterium tapiri TaxID=1448266 RepID=A0A5C4U1W4_9CORY|nr:GNAT family N-acetyltransferase [Corynebacterium tapiri]TNL95742.1 GNAT family N-acetyltransferase [Corynebacterium tapiri]